MQNNKFDVGSITSPELTEKNKEALRLLIKSLEEIKHIWDLSTLSRKPKKRFQFPNVKTKEM